MKTMSHTEDCVNHPQYDDGTAEVECRAIYGEWMQPPGQWVGEAESRLDDDAPWCQVHALAWRLAEVDV